ncbi:lysophospholipid acyltransferase family protein [Methylacidimicrobium tartarophylax]|uniref:1-acyl-sn-glycerol-3-phosphate acyltransferase n=1 Tax=Methylacidimicrobium tartarophylax TaxID=1041768 RepID=A0A5E6MGY4_9BACT|nr:lysophospholipid acyltransferase family protein [Methylacidimicrobium tartarophylax]VVM05334.1 1-acyl-sn-glycerol-3-phosphate acyltransferase [Methylacidimicrobium tartarophylax]
MGAEQRELHDPEEESPFSESYVGGNGAPGKNQRRSNGNGALGQSGRDRFFAISGAICHRVLRRSARISIEGLERIPKSGGCLLVCNHISHFDPILLGMESPRPIDYVADGKLFNDLVLSQILGALNVIPVDRNRQDPRAAKTAVGRLKQGRIVGLFPERGIRHGKASILLGARLNPSAAALARMANAPVLPAVVVGSDRLYQLRSWRRPPRVFVSFGELLTLAPGEGRGSFTERIHERLLSLFESLVKRYEIDPIDFPHSAQERWKEEGRARK